MEMDIVVNNFVETLVAKGELPEDVCARLQSLGWHAESAKRALKRFEQGMAGAPGTVVPGPDLDSLPSSLVVDGQAMQVEVRMHSPRLCLLGHVLTQQECEELIAIARPRLSQSMVLLADVDGEMDGVQSYSRTSKQANLAYGEHPLVDRIHQRIAKLTRWPANQMERLQVVRYGIGADFVPHHDFFCPKAHQELIATQGQRLASVILYLNTPDYGGITSFLDVELEIYPRTGCALYFSYPDTSVDSQTLHAGVPVVSGEKWIATFFLRDRVVDHANEES
jgi:prolyl 4-hydroxylase|nr:2OG-Fe(II) oxygenase [Dyella sp. ASV24]